MYRAFFLQIVTFKKGSRPSKVPTTNRYTHVRFFVAGVPEFFAVISQETGSQERPSKKPALERRTLALESLKKRVRSTEGHQWDIGGTPEKLLEEIAVEFKTSPISNSSWAGADALRRCPFYWIRKFFRGSTSVLCVCVVCAEKKPWEGTRREALRSCMWHAKLFFPLQICIRWHGKRRNDRM